MAKLTPHRWKKQTVDRPWVVLGTLGLMALNFALIAVFLFAPTLFWTNLRHAFITAALSGLALLVLGIVLLREIRLTPRPLRRWLQLMGWAAITPLAGTLLHNLFYALAEIFTPIALLFVLLHATAFLASTIIAPILFITGLIGTLVNWQNPLPRGHNQKKSKQKK